MKIKELWPWSKGRRLEEYEKEILTLKMQNRGLLNMLYDEKLVYEIRLSEERAKNIEFKNEKMKKLQKIIGECHHYLEKSLLEVCEVCNFKQNFTDNSEKIMNYRQCGLMCDHPDGSEILRVLLKAHRNKVPEYKKE